MEHPDLFCKAEKLEDVKNLKRKNRMQKPVYLKDIPLRKLVDEGQAQLFDSDKYPPCQCGL